MTVTAAMARAKAIAQVRAPWIPGVHLSPPTERLRRRSIFQHPVGFRWPAVPSEIVPDKLPTAEDVAIAGRLLAAFRAAAEAPAGASSQRQDLWALIADQQKRFATLLRTGDAEQLASYLCNVSRHDASIGITQGDREYRRIQRDRSYRRFLATMAKDKLVSLAEAVGALPVENPEQSAHGRSLRVPLDELVLGIGGRLAFSIAPPDVDGGMLKLSTSHGLFSERDVNAIFTAWQLSRLATRTSHICEIGAGSGRVAYWSRQLGLGTYTIVDLPHVNVVQGYYLLKSVPGERVLLYGDQDNERASGAEVTIWPNDAIGELPAANFDLVLNQDSMPEMSRATVDEYLEWIRDACDGKFVSINHESKQPYGDGLAHVSVPEVVGAANGFTVRDRYPYWLRKGYVVSTYDVSRAKL